MASIRRLDTGRYQVRWRDPAGRARSKTFATEPRAEAFRTRHEADAERGVFHDPRAGRQSLEAFWNDWRKTAMLEPSTLALYDGTWAKYVAPRFGGVSLNRITRADVEDLLHDVYDSSGSAWAAATVRRLLRMLLGRAVRRDKILRNVAAEVDLPRQPRRKRIAVLMPDAIDKLADAIGQDWRALVYLSAYGGFRFSEVIALRVEHIDVLRRLVRVEERIVEVRGQLHRGRTKTERSERVVTLPRFVMDELAAHLARTPASEDGLIFHDEDGGPIRRTNWARRVWRPARDRAGVPGFPLKNLRHCAASLAHLSGADMKHISARLGHASITTTANVYTELFATLDGDVAERLERLARPSVDGTWMESGSAGRVIPLKRED